MTRVADALIVGLYVIGREGGREGGMLLDVLISLEGYIHTCYYRKGCASDQRFSVGILPLVWEIYF